MGAQLVQHHRPASPAVGIKLEQSRCVHALNRFSACRACVDACVIGALQDGSSIALDREKCTGCAACLHVCPSGAIEVDDGMANLLEAAGRLRGRQVVELDCPRQRKPQIGPGDGALCTEACLAVLGPAAYLNLLALGVPVVVARTDACGACPLNSTQQGAVERSITQSVSTAKAILAAMGQDERLLEWSVVAGGEQRLRPVSTTSEGRVSRRDFLRVVTGRPAEEGLPAPTGEISEAAVPALNRAPLQRRRLLGALSRLGAAPQAGVVGPVPVAVFPRLDASEACTACGVCARVCPTGALSMTIHFDDTYTLSFLSAACTNCGECLAMCDYDALRISGAAELAGVLAMQPVILRQGDLLRCARCNTRFAGAAQARLCPICAFRAAQPLGGRLPPSLARQLARAGK